MNAVDRFKDLLRMTYDDPAIALRRLLSVSTAITRRVGVRGGSSVRRYICNGCGALVDTESSRNRPTRHAARAVDDHLTDCEVWNYWDNLASRIAFAQTDEELAVRLDLLMELNSGRTL